MKTYKTRILIGVLLCCLIFLLSACEPQDTSELIIGTWTPVSASGVLGGETHYLDASDYDAIGIMTFNGDGTLSGFDSQTKMDYEGWYWQIKGDKVITSNGDITWEYTIVKLDKSMLVLRIDLGDLDDYGFEPGDYIEGIHKRQG